MSIIDDIRSGKYQAKAYTHPTYREEQNKLDNQFRADALKEAGLADHPNADRIFNKAYERGHSSGYEEVWNELSDLADLFVEVPATPR